MEVILDRHKFYQGILLVQNVLSKSKFNAGGTTLYRRGSTLLSTQDPQIILEEVSFKDPQHQMAYKILKEESRTLIGKYGSGNLEYVELVANSIREFLKTEDKLKIINKLEDSRSQILNYPTQREDNVFKVFNLQQKDCLNVNLNELFEAIRSGGDSTSLCIKEGLKLGYEILSSVGYCVPLRYFDFNQEESYLTGKTLEEPIIIIYEGRLNSVKTLEGILNILVNNERPGILFCNGMSAQCRQLWLVNQKNRIVNLTVSFIPGDIWSDHSIVKDMLAVFGGESLHPLLHPEDLSEVDLDLGSSLRVAIKGKEAIFFWDQEDDLIQDRILNQIEALERIQGQKLKSSSKDDLISRVSNLSGNLITISVKGITDSETRYLMSQTEILVSYLYTLLKGDILEDGWRKCVQGLPEFTDKSFTKTQVINIIDLAVSTFKTLADVGVILCK